MSFNKREVPTFPLTTFKSMYLNIYTNHIQVSASPYFPTVNNSSFVNLSSQVTEFPRGVGVPVPVIAAPVVYRYICMFVCMYACIRV
jgi:hypothetical protein